MAGGIDWFRWHHGSVNDPKFGLIAKRSGASVAEVIAVWACLLESASAADERGSPGEQDFEAIDFALGMDDGKAARIYEHMTARSLIDGDGRVSSWDKRQPKREDDTAADRKRMQREREKAERASANVTQCHADVTQCHADVTQCHADVTQCHDRGEERRVDVNPLSVASASAPIIASAPEADPDPPVVPTPAGVLCARIRAEGIAEANPQHPKLLALMAAGITGDEIAAAAADSKAKGKGFAYALAVAEGRRRDAAQIAPLPNQGAPPNGRRRPTLSEEREAASIALTGRKPRTTTTDERTERDITAEATRLA